MAIGFAAGRPTAVAAAKEAGSVDARRAPAPAAEACFKKSRRVVDIGVPYCVGGESM
jgi:hypothetical protein